MLDMAIICYEAGPQSLGNGATTWGALQGQPGRRGGKADG